MTPFDPDALVAMLRAFYPIVGRAALARARAERPEYFAAGVLIGSSRTHLQLPDGRIFDLIFNEGGPQGKTGWQALDVTEGGPTTDDPFALEDGPLDPIDESAEFYPAFGGPSMESVVSGELAALDGAEPQLDTVRETVAAFDVSGAAGAITGPELDDAATAHRELRDALEADNPGQLVETSDGHVTLIDANSSAYEYELPGYIAEPVPVEKPEPPDHRPPKIPDEPK